jgi:hypothetical protein
MDLAYVETRGVSHDDIKIESVVTQPVTNVRPAPELGLPAHSHLIIVARF